jgi:predicted RNA binding protein YcfA (HicA-like mRNA interferase family)
MPPTGSISHRKLIVYLRQLGFSGPFGKSKHSIMRRGDVTVHIPNPHGSDISTGLLLRILGQAQVSRHEWEKL